MSLEHGKNEDTQSVVRFRMGVNSLRSMVGFRIPVSRNHNSFKHLPTAVLVWAGKSTHNQSSLANLRREDQWFALGIGAVL